MRKPSYLSLMGLLLCCSIASARTSPNVILFLVDDMGLMDTSVPMLADRDGKPKRHPLNDWYRTPNMERLAKVAAATTVPIATGENLQGLEKLTQLKSLDLYGNPDLTKAQIAELQKALPNCEIFNDPTK